MKLTVQQRKAINQAVANMQLIACAGSGKTEVVARRVVKLLDPNGEDKLSPANIIAFTFTDKAAGELKERIVTRCREQLGDITGLAELYVGTIHGFCLDLLKTEVPEYLKYEVLNEVQQSLFIDRNSAKSGLTASSDLRGSALKRYRDTPHYISALSLLREADVVDDELDDCSVLNGLDMYRHLLEARRYFDYSAILELAVDELSGNNALRERLSERIRYLIVDEYQDVNPIQEAIVWLLHDLGAKVCVVGDDDQTIYQWRGSDVENILMFRDRYPKVRQAALECNFRSSEGIVETARPFIEQNTARLPKAMQPTKAQTYELGDIAALSFDTPEEEAQFIAETIKELRGVAIEEDSKNRGISWSDMAILLRSVRKNGAAITEALSREGIPFVIGGMNNLFDTPEARAARELSYFMANRPGVSRSSVQKAWEDATTGADPAKLKQAVREAERARDDMGGPEKDRWSVYNIQRQFLAFLESAGIREDTVPDGRGEVLFYNLGKFSQLISDFESIHFHSKPLDKYDSFANFLQYRADSAYPEGWQDNQYANPDAVRIMTVHQAKGMEWPVVFIPALLKNRFPSKKQGGRSVWHLIPKASIKGQIRYEGTLEDERRLFYVAMTRSQKFLFMTWAPIPSNQLFRRVSEFWEDVLASKYVKRRRQDYSKRKRLKPIPKTSVANVLLSFSDLKYFFECPYQFKMRILYGFNPPLDEALGYGKSLHDALAEVHARAIRGDIADPEESARLVDTHLHTPYAYSALQETLRNAAVRSVENYLVDNQEDFDKLEFSEKSIEINLGGGVTVAGRIDLVRRTDTDEVSIVDLKSTKRAQSEDLTETQLHIYALGYQELTGRNADYVEIYNLDERKRKPRSVDEDFLDDVKSKVRKAANALRKGALDARPAKKRCSTCDYCRICTAGIEVV